MGTFVPFGPGTLTVGDGETDYACEVLGGGVVHAYEEVGEARTTLCGTTKSAARKRSDSLKFTLENDLTDTGLYAMLVGFGDDPPPTTFEYTPNTASAASWSGTIIPLAPGEVSADEYSKPLGSSVEWPGVGLFTFVPAAGAP